MKINHRTSDEFRRELRIYEFPYMASGDCAKIKDFIGAAIDALEACESELKKHIPEPRRCYHCHQIEPKHIEGCRHEAKY